MSNVETKVEPKPATKAADKVADKPEAKQVAKPPVEFYIAKFGKMVDPTNGQVYNTTPTVVEAISTWGKLQIAAGKIELYER